MINHYLTVICHLGMLLGHADRHSPFNLREVTREQHAVLDPYRGIEEISYESNRNFKELFGRKIIN